MSEPATHPRYGEPRAVGPAVSVLLQENPGTMTLDGTNTWLLREPGAARTVVVDPGEAGEPGEAHLDRLVAAAGDVELIVLTHHHHDHTGLAAAFAERTGAPVRALDPALCRGGEPLADGEEFAAGGLVLRVDHTPGHTADSVCLRLGAHGVLTGDTILGRGTTVLDDLGAYLGSLRVLAGLPAGTPVLPGHGPDLPDVAETAAAYLAHREQRLDQVRGALDVLGADATVRSVVEHVYADVDPALWPAADYSVRAQLDYLRGA